MASNRNTSNDDMNFIEVDDNLMKQLIQTEAAIKKAETEIKTNEKKINQIKNSNTWKRTAPFRKLKGKKSNIVQQITDLEASITSIKDELYESRKILSKLGIEKEKLNYNELWRLAKEEKDAGRIIDLIEEKINEKQTYDTNYNNFIKATARLFMNERKDYQKFMYPKLLSGLKIEDTPEFMIRAGLTENPISLNTVASYRASLNMRQRMLQLKGALPEILLDDKQLAYEFMKQLKIRTPKISEQIYRFSEIPEVSSVAIKPLDGAGARGVYLVYDNDDIIDIKQSKKIANWQVLKKNMERDLESGRVNEDAWFTEELILEDKATKLAARDIKFYCFYGKVALILEIVRYPELQYAWWTANGERVSTGKYEESLFKGTGVSQSEIEMAASISTEIPAPFIRIDFLRSEDGLVFGEFTPKPGNYDEFDNKTDQWLGDYYLDAEGRLMHDLINGKDFLQYKKIQIDK